MLKSLRAIVADRQTWPLLSLLPMLVFAVGMLVAFAHEQGRETVAEMRRHLEVLTRGVDRRIAGQFGLLNAISSLPWIRDRDFASLKPYLEGLRPTYPAWRNVIVTDLERQIFNLNTYPEVAPFRDPSTIATVVRSRAPIVGAVRDGVFPIRGPVERTGDVTMTMVIVLHQSAIAEVFQAPNLPAGWGAIVVDAQNDIVATTGAGLADSLATRLGDLATMGRAVDGDVRRIDLGGEDLLLVTSAIAQAGWTVVLLAPNTIVYAGDVRIDHILYAAAVLAALASGSLLWMLSRNAHRRTEELAAALRRQEASEQRFRDGIESMGEGFLLFDGADRLEVWNRRYLEIQPDVAGIIRVGMTGRELATAALEAGQGHLSAEERQRAIENRLAARERLHGFAYTTSDGRRIEVSDRRASTGGIVSIIHDATVAHRWAQRLAESEVRFRDFAETASDWFWETDPDHRYTFLISRRSPSRTDPGFAIGKTRIEIARHISSTVPEALFELERMMNRRESFHGFEYTRPHIESGEATVFEVSGKPVYGADGAFLGYRGTGRDVTQRKRQELELARALAAEQAINAEQRRFIAIVSHEFRTPLTIIDGATQRIGSRLAAANPEIAKRLERIRAAVSRMTDLIDRTLSSARLDTGGIELSPSVFDVVALLREVCERQRQAAPEFSIEIDGTETPMPIEADPRLIDQVLSNLLSNAVKYSGRARSVTVVVKGDGAAVEIAVTDHGVGIPSDELPKMFTRFFRARTANGVPGTGFGLNLCRDLVQMHGGTITVESTLGVGSTFRVRIPRHLTSAPNVAA